MGLLSWIGIVLGILKYAPEMIEIIRAIIKLIRSLSPEDQALAKAEIGEAVASRDKDLIRERLEKWRKRCHGTGCPADLVGA